MILVFSEKITPRLEYIARFIFSEILQTDILFTTNASEFRASRLPKINYSPKKLDNELFVSPHELLFQNEIYPENLKQINSGGINEFFKTSPESDLPFDLLAASFYLVSRYEEYPETGFDLYGRYPASKSILTKFNLLKKPVVDIWANELAGKLRDKYPQLVLRKRKPLFISTIDIDNAWAYRHKGFWRTGGAIAKALLKGNFAEVANRVKVLTGKEQDPYDTYSFLNDVFNGHEKQTHFFFLLGNYARYDKNISPANKHFRQLIREIAGKYPVGIHPSFFSGTEKKNLITEIQRLETTTGEKVKRSRQHYLKLTLPETYRRLIGAGIEEDFSMGYASHPGFRAGTCTPFLFYDLPREQATNLKVVPFQMMDVMLRNYLQLNPEESLEEIGQLMNEVKNAGGTFVSIWHNENLNNQGRWEGFRQVFEKMNQTGFAWEHE